VKRLNLRLHCLSWVVQTTSHALTRSQNYLILLVLLGVGAVCSYAQTPDPRPEHAAVQEDRPPLTPLPAEQDWGFLRDASKRIDPLDKLKYFPIGDSAQRYLSLGLDYRGEYEYFDNWALGEGPQDHNGYLLNRAIPHFDLHLGTDARLFTEFQFGYEGYRNGGPRPGVDEDKGDVHQAFLEVGSRVSHERGFSLRVGRQEIVLGSGKLFDNNEGLNVKLSFDGVRFIAQSNAVRWDIFATKPVEDNPGFFDDAPIHTQTTWGSYLTVPSRLDKRGFVDLYYLGLSTKNAAYRLLTSVGQSEVWAIYVGGSRQKRGPPMGRARQFAFFLRGSFCLRRWLQLCGLPRLLFRVELPLDLESHGIGTYPVHLRGGAERLAAIRLSSGREQNHRFDNQLADCAFISLADEGGKQLGDVFAVLRLDVSVPRDHLQPLLVQQWEQLLGNEKKVALHQSDWDGRND
jgi:Alginate export